MLKLRLIRGGQKNKPHYKIAIMQAKTKRNGFVIEKIGFYNPKTKDFKLKVDRILKHLKYGIQPTKRLQKFLQISNIIFNKN